MTEPLVSVCIPTFNGSRFLNQTIQSVLSQTYTNIEVLISDHSSSDETVTIINSFSDPRLSLIVLGSGGSASDNWNNAVVNARGKYVKLICQDDILKKNCIQEQVRALEEHPDASFCFSPRDIVSPGGRRIIRSRGWKPANDVVLLEDELSTVIRSGTNPFGEPCSVLIRESALKSVGRYEGSYLIDFNMCMKLWSTAPAIFLNKSLSQFRISNSSWTSKLVGQQAQQMSQKYLELCKNFPTLICTADTEMGIRQAKKLESKRLVLTKIISLLHI